MSFLGSISHLMAGTGLKEILELFYAENTTSHILSGKAVSRALRGHFLIDSALNSLLLSRAFSIDHDFDGSNESTDTQKNFMMQENCLTI